MQKIIFYIVVHSKSIIDLFEKTKKYEKLGVYKYLLVGKHAEDHTNDAIIQCDRLDGNIEDQKHLTAYTAWYVLSKHLRFTDGYDFICLLEYDVDVTGEFNLEQFTENLQKLNLPCCSISKMHISEGIFVRTHFTELLFQYFKLKNITKIEYNRDYWMTTNNLIFRPDFFKRYFNDDLVLDFIKFLGNDRMSGHSLERFVSVYCFLNKIDFDAYEDCGLVHRGLDSHQTQGIHHKYEQFKTVNQISD